MNSLPSEKVEAIIAGFYEGKSNRQIAKSSQVALRTVIAYRRWQVEFWRKNPEYAAEAKLVCGCGRPIKSSGPV